MILPYLTEPMPGIGGTLKQRVDDFFVQEIALYEPCGDGEHLYFEVQKTGITTFEAIRRLSRALRVRERDIGYAGLKDARAITRQVFSIAGVSESAVMNAFLPEMSVLWASRHANKLRLGHLAGNRFAVKIRHVRPTDVVRLRPMLNVLEQKGLPNYFGQQRFGRHGDNDRLGAAVLSGDDDGLLQQLRNHGEAGGMERRVLDRWEKTKNSAAALKAIDHKVQRLWLSALQSRVFNSVVASRIASLTTLLHGDLAYVHASGACFAVTSVADEQPRCDGFEISPSGPMIGDRMDSPTGEPLAIEQAAMAEVGITHDGVRSSQQRWLRGTRRPLRVRPTDISLEAGVDDHGGFITVAFTLPAGAYATVLLRELMKNDLPADTGASRGDERADAQSDEDSAEHGHETEA